METLQTTLSRIEHGEVLALELIEALLSEKHTIRESRRIKMALQTARLTTVKSLSGYDFSFQPGRDRHRVMVLAEVDFVERKHRVYLLGPPDTGKSNLAIAHRASERSRPAKAFSSPRWASWSFPGASPSAKASWASA